MRVGRLAALCVGVAGDVYFSVAGDGKALCA